MLFHFIISVTEDDEQKKFRSISIEFLGIED